jgi:uncharacterized protein YbjT (DUF2867 family)
MTRADESSAAPVLVIGATGRLGREVVAQLRRARVPVRALTRQPATAAFPSDVELAVGDLGSPESLEHAMDGARAAFIIWTAPPATAADVIARLARRVERIVFLSSPHQTPHPFFQQRNRSMTLHEDIERLIADSGRASTIIRPGMFAGNCILWWASQIQTDGVVRWPYGAVETAPIDERDIAAVAVRSLIEDGHTGRDYVITGPTSLSHADQVLAIGNALGRRLRFHELSPDEFRNETAERFARPAVEMLLAAWGAAAGIPAYVTSTVAEVTGTPARSFAEWATANVSAFEAPTRPGRSR